MGISYYFATLLLSVGVNIRQTFQNRWGYSGSQFSKTFSVYKIYIYIYIYIIAVVFTFRSYRCSVFDQNTSVVSIIAEMVVMLEYFKLHASSSLVTLCKFVLSV